MGNLRRILREVRQEVDRITDKAPAGPGDLELSSLVDEELDRLEQL